MSRLRVGVVIGVVSALAAVGAGCGSSSSPATTAATTTTTTPPATTTAAAATAATTALQLAADANALKFDKTSLSAPAGKVTIDLTNPSAIPHDVVIEQGSKQIVAGKPITQSSETVTANLTPGTYTFYCDVPGHRQAGMEGTLTVK